MRFFLSLISALLLFVLSSCSDDSIMQHFTHAKNGDRAYIEITKTNLINLHKLNAAQFEKLMGELDMLKSDSPNNEGILYMPPIPKDGYPYDVQVFERWPKTGIVKVGFTKVEPDKDHFAAFKKANKDQFVPNSNTYVFNFKNSVYFIKFEEGVLENYVIIGGSKVGAPLP